jgi:hypothetical protein
MLDFEKITDLRKEDNFLGDFNKTALERDS